jgi:hypothetical protein
MLLFFAAPAIAGTSYRFQSKTEGIATASMSGVAEVEGGKMRVQFDEGDNLMFKKDAVVISTDGGKTLAVLDSHTHTYFNLSLDNLASSIAALGTLSVTNAKATTSDAGEGGTIEGFPAHKSVIDVSYDLDAGMGEPMHITMHSDIWSTDKISGDAATFMQTKDLHTGMPAVDKLIEAQTAALRGRFPLKNVMTMTVKSSMVNITTTNSSSVTDIKTKNVPASDFVIPDGYEKTESPIERMTKMK